MEFYPLWKFHGNGLLCVCPESNFFCPLTISIYISRHISIGKGHLHIRDIRLPYCIIIKLHCQTLSGTICPIKRITASIGIRRSQMGNNKTLSCGKVCMMFCKKSGRASSFRTVVTDLCQFSVSFQLCNLVSPASRSRF